jgi:hypothetical protein
MVLISGVYQALAVAASYLIAFMKYGSNNLDVERILESLLINFQYFVRTSCLHVLKFCSS